MSSAVCFNLDQSKILLSCNGLNDPEKKEVSGNIVGEGENAGNKHLLLFPQCFIILPESSFNFSVIFILSPANAFDFEQSKIFSIK